MFKLKARVNKCHRRDELHLYPFYVETSWLGIFWEAKVVADGHNWVESEVEYFASFKHAEHAARCVLRDGPHTRKDSKYPVNITL